MKKRLIAFVEPSELEKLAQQAFDNMTAGKGQKLCEYEVERAEESLVSSAEKNGSEWIHEPDSEEYIKELKDNDSDWEVIMEMCDCEELESDEIDKLCALVNDKFVADGYDSTFQFIYENGWDVCSVDWDKLRYETEQQEKSWREETEALKSEYWRSVL